MRKLNHAQRVAAILIVVVGLIILALWSVFRPRLRPERNIPDLEIMYLSDIRTLHFINSEGTAHEERRVNVSLLHAGWSLDGQSIVARQMTTFPRIGYPVLITLDGRFKACKEYEDEGDLQGIGGHLVALTDREVDEIYVVDMNTCSKVRTLYSSPSEIGVFSLSPDGWLAIWEAKQLLILDAEGQEVYRSESKMSPGSWSPDGEWLTGVKESEIYVMRKDGSERRLLAKRGSFTSWSPDGQWVVYSVVPDSIMYRINVSTGETIELAQDVHNWVSWRSID